MAGHELLGAFKTANLSGVQQHRDARDQNALSRGIQQFSLGQAKQKAQTQQNLSNVMANGGTRQDQQKAAYQMSPEMGMKLQQHFDAMDENKRAGVIKEAQFNAKWLRNVQNQKGWDLYREMYKDMGYDASQLPEQYDPNLLNDMEAKAKWTSDVYAKPRELSGKDMVQIVGADGKPMFIPADQAVGQVPYEKPESKDRKTAKDANGVLRYLDTGEQAFPGVEVAPDPLNGFDEEAKLRSEFDKSTKVFTDVRDAYGRIAASINDPSASGDLALIFNFMKMLDPGSTVREGEFATAQNAGGIDERVQGLYNQIMSGERLTPQQRQDFSGRAQKLYSQQEAFYNQSRERYTKLANEYQLNPNRVISDIDKGLPNDTPQQPITLSGAEAPTDLKVGQVYVGRNGQTAVWDGDSFEPIE